MTEPGATSQVHDASAGVFPPRPVTTQGQHIGSVTPLTRPWAAIFATVAVIIMLFALFILYFLNVRANAQIKSHDQAIVELNQKLTTEPLLSVAKQAAVLNQAIQGYTLAAGNQLDYAFLNSEIARVTPKNVHIGTLSIDDKGTVRISATANDFTSAGKALLAYRQTSVLNTVSLPTVALTEKDGTRQIAFTIAATLNKGKLKPKSATVTPVPTDQVTP